MDPHIISYSKNGVDLGTCFEIEKESLEGAALFPHVLSKNSELVLNFGQQEEPFFPLKEGYVFINAVPVDERVRGTLPPEKKEDCEVRPVLLVHSFHQTATYFWAARLIAEWPVGIMYVWLSPCGRACLHPQPFILPSYVRFKQLHGLYAN